MAPKPSSSPQSSQGNKKQQSISSFFTRKPSSTQKPTVPAVAEPSPKPTHSEPNGADHESEDDLPAHTSQRSSSQARKRVIAESDEEDGAPLPQSKKAKTSPVVEPTARSPDRVALAEGASTNQAKSANRTSKYLFSSSPAQVENRDEAASDDEAARKQKEKLHERFVKKLGRPDAIADIRRRNHVLVEDGGDDNQDDEDNDEAEEETASKSKGKRTPAVKKAGSKLTPMERQVIDIKRKHMDTVLVVEVGYKFRFFGEDARTAAKELGIVCIPGKFRFDEHPSEAHLDKFASASIPTHRLHVHVKRLVNAGHKVGVVRQLETAALKKAGDNRNAPFVRQLTNVYTKATYIDDVEGLEGPPAGGDAAPASGYILCLTETNAKGWSTDEKVHIGIVAVQPTTGDVIYDDFEDGFMRSEVETRLLHIAPVEFLIVGELSKATEKIIAHLSGSRTNVFGDQARVERTSKSKTAAAESFSHISSFYAGKMKETDSASQQEHNSAILDKVHQLSELVTICLSAMIKHMTEYGLEHVFDLTKYFQPFSARSHMLLNGNTLTSLEIYLNQTDHTEKGSLFWSLNRTKTRFGHRLLRRWVGRPLLDQAKLEERIAAVEELKDEEHSSKVDKLKYLLNGVKSDLEKSLIRIYYKKCARPELLAVLQTLQRISTEYAHVTSPEKAGFKSSMINEAIASLPRISEDVIGFLDKINPQAAKADDKYSFFREEHETEAIQDHQLGIASVEHELDEFRQVAAAKIKRKKIDYVTVSGIEYLIEVETSQVKNVPASWVKISGTKKVSRFHTPEVIKMLRERDQQKESLAAACDAAFAELLAEIGSKYQEFRDCIQSLAVLDCLLSFAEVANQSGYVKPTFDASSTTISVTGGRHPMVEQLLLDSYVPNDILLSQTSTVGPRALLITGPNMGGKSSYVRSVALIAIMGQVGSYVPAESASLPLLDAVFTRMGAFDNMMKGESTFMVELSETSDILKQATPRSLVILDELGRGTSTHDGVAIANAVLDFMVRDLKALTLFITHYQSLSRAAASFPNGELKNVHMRFTEAEGEGSATGGQITFLYEVGEGVAHRSYGLNVARLANVPQNVLKIAGEKSTELEQRMKGVMVGNLWKMMSRVLEGAGDSLDALVEGIEQL